MEHEYLEEHECLTPQRNRIQRDNLHQGKMGMLLTLFSLPTPQLSQASLKSFLCVLCTAHSAAATSEDGFKVGNVQRF